MVDRGAALQTLLGLLATPEPGRTRRLREQAVEAAVRVLTESMADGGADDLTVRHVLGWWHYLTANSENPAAPDAGVLQASAELLGPVQAVEDGVGDEDPPEVVGGEPQGLSGRGIGKAGPGEGFVEQGGDEGGREAVGFGARAALEQQRRRGSP